MSFHTASANPGQSPDSFELPISGQSTFRESLDATLGRRQLLDSAAAARGFRLRTGTLHGHKTVMALSAEYNC